MDDFLCYQEPELNEEEQSPEKVVYSCDVSEFPIEFSTETDACDTYNEYGLYQHI